MSEDYETAIKLFGQLRCLRKKKEDADIEMIRSDRKSLWDDFKKVGVPESNIRFNDPYSDDWDMNPDDPVFQRTNRSKNTKGAKGAWWIHSQFSGEDYLETSVKAKS